MPIRIFTLCMMAALVSTTAALTSGRALADPTTETCTIPATSSPLQPATITVSVDGTTVGSITLSQQGSTAVTFQCTDGTHQFTFAADQPPATCNGSFTVDANDVNFAWMMRPTPSGLTCSLTSTGSGGP